MNFLNYPGNRIFKFLIFSLTLLFLINIITSFSASPKQAKKGEDQNIVFFELNSNTNILIDSIKPDKRIFVRVTGINDIKNYFDNSVGAAFKKYHTSTKNSLCNSNSTRTFITALFSTDT